MTLIQILLSHFIQFGAHLTFSSQKFLEMSKSSKESECDRRTEWNDTVHYKRLKPSSSSRGHRLHFVDKGDSDVSQTV